MSYDLVIYRDANGAAWYLVTDVEANQVLVLYEPEQGSSKQSTLIELNAFLLEEHGPQHTALTCLLREMGFLLPIAR